VNAWGVGTVVVSSMLTGTGRSIVLDVPGWGGNLAGQHADVRLTAPDGYTATRSYSVATAGPGDRVELVVDRLPDGEVSPFLVDELRVGDELEIRGPLGGWFVWRPETTDPVQLIGGGSGIVPLLAMVRAHRATRSTAELRLLYSVRSPADAFYPDELAAAGDVALTWWYTRETPDGWPRPAARITADGLAATVLPAAGDPDVYVCGPTGFVEHVARLLVELGHHPDRVRTERFGGM